MKSACAITIPGVLQKLVTSAPIPVGIQLYHGLATTFQLLLVTDDDKEKTDYWLRLENLNKHGVVLYGDNSGLQPAKKRLSQVNSLRLRGFSVDMVIEPDPEVAAVLIRSGFSVCNFLHFAYAFPSWRPDFEESVRPWEELERQVIEDQLAKAQDTRMDELQ